MKPTPLPRRRFLRCTALIALEAIQHGKRLDYDLWLGPAPLARTLRIPWRI